MFLNSKKLVCHVPEQRKACAPCSCTEKSLCAMFLNRKKLVRHVPEQQKACAPHVPEQQKACVPCSWTAKSLCSMFLYSKKFGKSLDGRLCGKVLLKQWRASIHEWIFSKWPKSIDAKVVLPRPWTFWAYSLIVQVCALFFLFFKLIGEMCDNWNRNVFSWCSTKSLEIAVFLSCPNERHVTEQWIQKNKSVICLIAWIIVKLHIYMLSHNSHSAKNLI